MNISSSQFDELLDSMAADLRIYLQQHKIENPIMVGIHTGRVWIAEALHKRLGLSTPLSTLDISFYRDDFTRIGMNPQVRPSELTSDINKEHIILVDDVLYTGRTIRAAMNEIFDYGRPASIALAVLIDRGERELPIGATVVGKQMSLKPGEHIKIHGPDPLGLSIIEQEAS